MFKPAVAFLLVILSVVNPLVYASTTPTVTKECIALGNAFNLVPPTDPKAAAKSTHAARTAITKNWATWVKANQSKLAGVESALAANRSAFVGSDVDVTPLYNALHSAGSNLTLTQVKKMATSTSAQREQLLDAVQSQGLANTLIAIGKNGDPFGTRASASPDDGAPYCYLMSVGNDMLALGALVALFNPEVGAMMAAIGAALYLYGEYVSCTFNPGDGLPDYFFTD